jgi:hypothetical protein
MVPLILQVHHTGELTWKYIEVKAKSFSQAKQPFRKTWWKDRQTYWKTHHIIGWKKERKKEGLDWLIDWLTDW